MSITIKKALTRAVAVSLFASAIILTAPGCGGGGGDSKGGSGGSGGGSVKVKSNEFIGAIPSIIVNYDNAKKALQEKKKAEQEAAEKKQNVKKYTAAAEAYDKASTALMEKYEADKKAEWGKVKGKDVPFTMDDKFKALKMEVKSVKVDGDKGGFSVNLVATEDLKINYTNNSKYGWVVGKFLAKDGTEIYEHRFFVNAFMTQTTVKAGQPMYHDGGEMPSGAINYNEKWADFASVQFVAPE